MIRSTAHPRQGLRWVARGIVSAALVLAVGPPDPEAPCCASAAAGPVVGCGTRCPDYDDGFEWGDEGDIGDPDDCPRPSEAFLLGCIDAVVLKVLFDPEVRQDGTGPAAARPVGPPKMSPTLASVSPTGRR